MGHLPKLLLSLVLVVVVLGACGTTPRNSTNTIAMNISGTVPIKRDRRLVLDSVAAMGSNYRTDEKSVEDLPIPHCVEGQTEVKGDGGEKLNESGAVYFFGNVEVDANVSVAKLLLSSSGAANAGTLRLTAYKITKVEQYLGGVTRAQNAPLTSSPNCRCGSGEWAADSFVKRRVWGGTYTYEFTMARDDASLTVAELFRLRASQVNGVIAEYQTGNTKIEKRTETDGRVTFDVVTRDPQPIGVELSLYDKAQVCKERGLKAGVLILGGQVASGRWTNNAQYWDLDSRTWQSVSSVPDTNLCRARAVRLGDGRVLLAGGGGENGCSDDGSTTPQGRWFMPDTKTWHPPKCDDPCVKLSNGRRFKFDPDTNEWREEACRSKGRCMMYGRNNFPALALANGKAFVYGGCAGGCNGPNAIHQTVAGFELAHVAEIFDPNVNTWSATPPSRKPRANAAAVEVSGGRVLVCGGSDGFNAIYDDCELYDLNSDFNGHRAWSWAGQMPIGRAYPQLATVRGGEAVLGIANGHWWIWTWKGDYWKADENDVIGEWHNGGELPARAHDGVLTSLADGRVLLTGGRNASEEPLNAVHIFQYDSITQKGSWHQAKSMTHARYGHSAVELSKTGDILVVGGCGAEPHDSAEWYDIRKDAWVDAGKMSMGRCLPLTVELR